MGYLALTFLIVKFSSSKKGENEKIKKTEKKIQKNPFFYPFFQDFQKWKFGPSTLFHLKIIGPRLTNYKSPKYQNFKKWHF